MKKTCKKTGRILSFLILIAFASLFCLTGCSNAKESIELMKTVTEYDYNSVAESEANLIYDLDMAKEKAEKFESYIIRGTDGLLYQTDAIQLFGPQMYWVEDYRSYYYEGMWDENKNTPTIYELQWHVLKKVSTVEAPYYYAGPDMFGSVNIYEAEDETFYLSMNSFEIDGEIYINPMNAIEVRKISQMEYIDSVYEVKELETTKYFGDIEYTDTETELNCIQKAYYNVKFSDGRAMKIPDEYISKDIQKAFESSTQIFF